MKRKNAISTQASCWDRGAHVKSG